jgi:hypothetical protein
MSSEAPTVFGDLLYNFDIYGVKLLVFESAYGDSTIVSTAQQDVTARQVKAIASYFRRTFGWAPMLEGVTLDDYVQTGYMVMVINDDDLNIGIFSEKPLRHIKSTPVTYGEF